MAREHQARVLITPFPGIGHINPLFNLAHHLASLDISCTVLIPARYHPRLVHVRPLPPLLHLVAARDGLPTDPSFHHSIPQFIESIQTMEAHVDSLLGSNPPFTCLISDNVISWSQSVADRHGVPRLDFWPVSVRAVSMIYHMRLLASEGHIRPLSGGRAEEQQDHIISCIPGLPEMRASDFVENVLVPDPDVHQLYLGSEERMTNAKAVIVSSVFELETEAVDALVSNGKLPDVYTVGPLLPYSLAMHGHIADDDGRRGDAAACLEWLDSQAPCSVLYVAFGSTGFWSADEMKQLTMGLERSEQPFLWVVRTTLLRSADDVDPSNLLSPEAQRRCRIISWAPQVAVLQHPSVGGFLTHCGWNSVMESLYMGVPMIGWPKMADHATNMRMVAVEWRVGIALARRIDGHHVSSAAVEEAVRSLLKGQFGKEARQRALGLSTLLRGAHLEHGSSRLNLERLASQIKAM